MYKISKTAVPITTEQEAAAARDLAILRAQSLYESRIAKIKKLKSTPPKSPEPSSREKLAWELRQSGGTFKAIGAELGVSTGRASQIVKKYQRFKDRQAAGICHM